MKDHISLSVIIPVYNAAIHLPRLYNSLCEQTFKSFEVIFIDDSSKDASWDMLCEYSKRDVRFHVHQMPKNLGAGYARNKGIELASGKYIHFLDSDDCYAQPMALETMVDYIEKSCSDLVLFRYNVTASGSSFQRQAVNVYEEKVWNLMVEKDEVNNHSCHTIEDIQPILTLPAFPWNKMYSRDFLLENDICFSHTMLHEDIIFAWKSLVLARRISLNTEVVVNHYYSQTNTFQATNQKDTYRFELFSTLNEIDEFVHDIDAKPFLFPWLARFKLDTLNFGIGKVSRNLLPSFAAATKHSLSVVPKRGWKKLRYLPFLRPIDRCKYFLIRFFPLAYAYVFRFLRKFVKFHG
jgi:glycosyltransferase involved in cell wall biosynthesis